MDRAADSMSHMRWRHHRAAKCRGHSAAASSGTRSFRTSKTCLETESDSGTTRSGTAGAPRTAFNAASELCRGKTETEEIGRRSQVDENWRHGRGIWCRSLFSFWLN